MRNAFLSSLAIILFVSCSSKKENKEPKKKNINSDYVISKDGIGDLKIGMTQGEVEKIVGQSFNLKADKDSWSDTVKVKYKDIDVSLYFMREYVTEDSGYMKLGGLETSSSLCKTADGLGVGDERSTILSSYENNPITMGPDSEMLNDTTWAMSKIKYSIYVKDTSWEKEVIFHLINKKVSSLEAGMIMGD